MALLRRALPRTVVLPLLLAAGCAQVQLGRIRFENQPPVWWVNDRRDTPVRPQPRPVGVYLYSMDGLLLLPLRSTATPSEAVAGVNSLGEVPDSTWFTNRIGRRQLTAEQVARGPLVEGDAPERHLPWTIQSTKPGGRSVGFVIKDARGAKYILKFDARGIPETETATDVIVNRVLWACGYNVPEDSLAWIRRSDLIVSPDAVVKDAFGDTRPLSVNGVDRMLAGVEANQDGTYRVLLSRYLPGQPIGGFSRIGVRVDDPNDVIPHQRRRDVRGQYPIFAWLNHTDVKDANTLDTWIEDPRRTGTHHVVHYLLDFGKALGGLDTIDGVHHNGFAYELDIPDILLSLLSLGLWRRPWDNLSPPGLRGVGLLESERFDPGSWHPMQPYFPFSETDRFDAFWGAKIVASFSRAHIEAAVDAGALSTSASRDYLVRTLLERQAKTLRTWFERVTPLDGFAISPQEAGNTERHQLCFDDLWIRHGLNAATGGPTTSYVVSGLDGRGAPLPWTAQASPDTTGHACVADVPASESPERYTMIRIVVTRGATTLPELMLHLAADPASGSLRVIGLERG